MDRLAGVKAETGGPFTRAQALGAGFSLAEVRRLLARGVWVSVRRGVYVEASVRAAAVADERRAHALDVAALLLALGGDACAAGMSAARIWGLDLLVRPPAELVVVTGEEGAKGCRGGDFVLRAAGLPEQYRGRRYRVPVTSVARTVVDVARSGSLAGGVVVADSALRLGLASVSRLGEVVRDCRGWGGLDTAQRAVALADPQAESALESVSRVAMYEQDVPPPRTQVPLGADDRQVGRVDFYWPRYGVIGEADGLGKYEANGRDSTRAIVRREKRREERLADLGFEVVRWGWEDAGDPPRLARRLRAAFARGLERDRGRRAS